MQEVSIIGLDLAKNLFQVHGPWSDGSVAFRRKISRAKLLSFFPVTQKVTSRHGGLRKRPPLGSADQRAGT
jgi:hypothetical protein